MEEIRKSLYSMSEELSKVANQQAKLLGLMEDVRELKSSIKEKDKKIADLEQHVDDLEQYSHMDDLIISQLKIRHKTFAWATAGGKGEDALLSELASLEKHVLQFFQSQNVNTNPCNSSLPYIS